MDIYIIYYRDEMIVCNLKYLKSVINNISTTTTDGSRIWNDYIKVEKHKLNSPFSKTIFADQVYFK